MRIEYLGDAASGKSQPLARVNGDLARFDHPDVGLELSRQVQSDRFVSVANCRQRRRDRHRVVHDDQVTRLQEARQFVETSVLEAVVVAAADEQAHLVSRQSPRLRGLVGFERTGQLEIQRSQGFCCLSL